MSYDLMLLADPGPEREEVLRVLAGMEGVRRDPSLETRFWLAAPGGEAQVNIGTKDPVESVHVEFAAGDVGRMSAVARRALELAGRLQMRVEDVLWGHEVTTENLPELEEFWRGLPAPGERRPAPEPQRQRPWWRPW